MFAEFNPENVEKVARLASLLLNFETHPVLSGNLALHGGTALNFFVLNPERLSLDLDLSYIASTERSQMLSDRKSYVKAIHEVGEELGFDVKAGHLEHAGCTLKLYYESNVTDEPGFVKVDLNFMNRSPLLPPETRMMNLPGFPIEYTVTSPIELVGGKVKAATERTVPRDLFDLIKIGQNENRWSTGDALLNHHIIFYYATLSDRFPNHGPLFSMDRYLGKEKDFESILKPVLPFNSGITYERLLEESAPVLKRYATAFDECEIEYAKELSSGRLKPEMLFEKQPELAERALNNPVAKRKVQNITKAIENDVFERDVFLEAIGIESPVTRRGSTETNVLNPHCELTSNDSIWHCSLSLDIEGTEFRSNSYGDTESDARKRAIQELEARLQESGIDGVNVSETCENALIPRDESSGKKTEPPAIQNQKRTQAPPTVRKPSR